MTRNCERGMTFRHCTLAECCSRWFVANEDAQRSRRTACIVLRTSSRRLRARRSAMGARLTTAAIASAASLLARSTPRAHRLQTVTRRSRLRCTFDCRTWHASHLAPAGRGRRRWIDFSVSATVYSGTFVECVTHVPPSRRMCSCRYALRRTVLLHMLAYGVAIRLSAALIATGWLVEL